MARVGKEKSRRHRTFRQSLRSESNFVLLRYLLLDGILTLNELSLALRMCKSRAAGWNHGVALFLRNQPSGLKLLHSGKLRAQAALATGTAWRWDTAFRIFCWLEVADFVLVFVFLFVCLVLHVSSHCFVVLPFSDLSLLRIPVRSYALRMAPNHSRPGFVYFNLSADFLDLRGLLFELRGEDFHSLLLLGDR
jgi:hypothetical protein